MLFGSFRGGNPLGRIVAKPSNCRSRANSRDSDIWETTPEKSVVTVEGDVFHCTTPGISGTLIG